MRHVALTFPLVAILLACSAACGNRQAAPAARQYQLRGQVIEVRPDVKEIRIKHEAVEGYMEAMTMSFAVKDAALLRDRTRGDLVRGTLMVTDSDAWLATLEKVGSHPVEEIVEDIGPAAAPLKVVQPGQPAPDAELVDQDGRKWHPSDARGKVLALTFIYTRCPLPNFCPLMDRNFVQIQKALAGKPALAGRVALATVSFDPAYDTPAVLKKHAQEIGADLSSWTFVTGPVETVDAFAGALGLSVIRGDEDFADITHNLRTVVVAPDGTVVKVITGNTWTPAELLSDIETAAAR